MNYKKLDRYYGNNRAAKVIYGTILIFVFLIGLHQHSEGSSSMMLSIKTFIAALTIIVAEIYAEIIGFTIKNKRALNLEERTEIYSDTFAIASMSLVPSIVLFMSSTGIYGIETAFVVAYLYCLSVLFGFSYAAGRLSGLRKSRSYILAGTTTVVGIVIILLKYTFGH